MWTIFQLKVQTIKAKLLIFTTLMGKAKEIKLEELVVKIGHDLNRSEHDIQKECDKLKKHWIVTLYDWLSLSEERRNLVGLPVMLNTKLEQLISIQSLEIETKEG